MTAAAGGVRAAAGGAWLLALPVAAFIVIFLAWPVATVLYTAFADGQGGFTLGHVGAFLSISLMREAFVNSLVRALGIGGARHADRGAARLPHRALRVPRRRAGPDARRAAAGDAAVRRRGGACSSSSAATARSICCSSECVRRSASRSWTASTASIFVEALHYFPFILLNLVAALRNIDGAMEEAAQNLGRHGFRLFRRVVFPLAVPGFVAGAALVFVKVFDDLGTPLVLNVTNMLAPQAYLRITSVGLEDPIGYVIALVMIVFSIGALALSAQITRGRDYATLHRGGDGAGAAAARPDGHAVVRLRLGRAGAGARALAAPRHPAAVVRHGVELLGAARRLHAAALRRRSHAIPAA